MVLLHFQLSHQGSVLEVSGPLLELILEAFWSLWGHFGHFWLLSWPVLGLQKLDRKKHPKFVAKRVCGVARGGARLKPAGGASPLREVTKGAQRDQGHEPRHAKRARGTVADIRCD